MQSTLRPNQLFSYASKAASCSGVRVHPSSKPAILISYPFPGQNPNYDVKLRILGSYILIIDPAAATLAQPSPSLSEPEYCEGGLAT